MSQDATRSKRLLKVTAGNIKNHHLYVRKPLDFFPPDCIGSPKKSAKASGTIEIILDGLDQVIETDITVDAKTRQPRFFRHP